MYTAVGISLIFPHLQKSDDLLQNLRLSYLQTMFQGLFFFYRWNGPLMMENTDHICTAQTDRHTDRQTERVPEDVMLLQIDENRASRQQKSRFQNTFSGRSGETADPQRGKHSVQTTKVHPRLLYAVWCQVGIIVAGLNLCISSATCRV